MSVTVGSAKDVGGEVSSLDADKDGLGSELAHGEGEVCAVVEDAAELMQFEVSVFGCEWGGLNAFDESVSGQAVLDQVGNGDELEIVLFLKFDEVGESCEGAVFVENFADDSAGVEPGELSEVDGSFGVPGALEDATGASAEGKDVPGLDELFGVCLWVAEDADGGGTVVGADTGGDAFGGVDGDGEVGTV